jgi:hypothetical protein
MPKSHWHYELHFGNRALLEPLLRQIGIDPAALAERNNGTAIEFSPDEAELLGASVRQLLDGLVGSDFVLAFPDRKTLCTVHHHRQLWWQTADPAVLAALRALS